MHSPNLRGYSLGGYSLGGYTRAALLIRDLSMHSPDLCEATVWEAIYARAALPIRDLGMHSPDLCEAWEATVWEAIVWGLRESCPTDSGSQYAFT